jgi:hypothetical protein
MTFAVLLSPDAGNRLLWLASIIGLAVALYLLRGQFSTETRARRRRDKSHRPVVSRKHGPTVRLAVEVKQPERSRKK